MTRNRYDRDHEDYNQSPANDFTTRNDLNGTVNSTRHRSHTTNRDEILVQEEPIELSPVDGNGKGEIFVSEQATTSMWQDSLACSLVLSQSNASGNVRPSEPGSRIGVMCRRGLQVIRKFVKFVGPGMMISVAYIDPVRYAHFD